MQRSIEHKGYVIEASARQCSRFLWFGAYAIRAKRTGEEIRRHGDAALAASSADACNHAITDARLHIDIWLRDIG